MEIVSQKEPFPIYLHSKSPVLLIDTSYYVFHRYYATLQWYGHRYSKEELPEVIANIHKDATFVEAFFKHVRADVRKWQNTWTVPHGNLLFGFDCPREKIWRHEIQQEYKGTRVPNPQFNKLIFPLFYQWFTENKETLGAFQIEVPSLEADDVLYLSTLQLSQLQPDSVIIILTNDNDYLQLRAPHIRLHNAKMQDLSERSIGTAEHDLLQKILMGDTSDNIPAVAPKIGPVTARKLALQGKEAVEAWVDEKGCRAQYDRNCEMIDFRKIPKDRVLQFYDQYEWIFV